MTDLYRLLLGVLCVWRITHFFQAEDGPWDVVVRIRQAAGEGFWGRLLDCFYCLSLWAAAPLAWSMGRTMGERSLMWLAFSGGAILAQRSTNRAIQAQPLALRGRVQREPGGLKVMACCGQRRALASLSGKAVVAGTSSQPILRAALYEYTGTTRMTVTGSVTGMRYRFGQPGAMVQVDSRDISSIAGLPNLRRRQ